MDLVYYIPSYLSSLIFVVGFFSSAIVLNKIYEVVTHYLKFKQFPLHPAEIKYIKLLDENRELKQKLAQYEEQQEQILEQMIEQLKDK